MFMPNLAYVCDEEIQRKGTKEKRKRKECYNILLQKQYKLDRLQIQPQNEELLDFQSLKLNMTLDVRSILIPLSTKASLIKRPLMVTEIVGQISY